MRRCILVAVLALAPMSVVAHPEPEPVNIDAIDAEAIESLRVKLDAHRAASQALEARLHEVLAAIAKKYNIPFDRFQVDLVNKRVTVAPVSSVAPVRSATK